MLSAALSSVDPGDSSSTDNCLLREGEQRNITCFCFLLLLLLLLPFLRPPAAPALFPFEETLSLMVGAGGGVAAGTLTTSAAGPKSGGKIPSGFAVSEVVGDAKGPSIGGAFTSLLEMEVVSVIPLSAPEAAFFLPLLR